MSIFKASSYRKFAIFGLPIATLILGWYFLLLSTPSVGDFPAIDLNRLREMAVWPGRPLPDKLRTVLIGEGSAARGFTVAGESLLEKTGIAIAAFEVVSPEGNIIIESGHSPEMHRKKFGMGFHPDAYANLQNAMRSARLILVTHEHTDHLGGVAHSPYLAQIAPRTLLTEEQLANPRIVRCGFSSADLKLFRPLKYDQFYSPAPGIVLIKAPGHSPGSQMIFVHLKGGKEFLFVGDIAWNHRAIEKETGKPFIINLVMLSEKRAEVAAELGALKSLEERSSVEVVVAHDLDQWHSLVNRGLVQVGLQIDAGVNR